MNKAIDAVLIEVEESEEILAGWQSEHKTVAEETGRAGSTFSGIVLHLQFVFCLVTFESKQTFIPSSGNQVMRDSIKMGKEETQLTTAPFDPRFPNQNQTKHCFTSFLDYKRCVKARGEEYAPCEYFKKVYTSLCPFSWVEKWEDQISEGRFPAKI